jgi:formate dehydrogenase gamma subunit
MWCHAVRLAVTVVSLALVPGSAALAQSSQGKECLTCHGSHGLGQSRRGGSLFVSGANLESSAHGHLDCVSCHRDASNIPHPSRLTPVRCVSCHAGVVTAVASGVHRGARGETDASCAGCHGDAHTVAAAPPQGSTALCVKCHAAVSAQYRESVHGLARAGGDTDAPECEQCHGSAHAIRSHLDTLSTVSHARLPGTCAHCHSDRQIVQRRRITIPEAVQLFRNSVHGRSSNPKAAVCNDCHESHDLRRASDPGSSIYRTNIPRTCGRCHAQELAQYTIGVHGQALKRGVVKSPVCTDCHGEHMIRGPKDLESPVAGQRLTETCSRCHEAEGIRQTFGLPAGRLSTYRDSFHGLAARGGSPAVANCASCHGAHDILPSSDPRSAVAPQRLGETCGKCHPGTNLTNRLSLVHVASTSVNEPIVFWVRITYLWLIGLVIGFMVLHQGLDFGRKLARHYQIQAGRLPPRDGGASRWFERMTLFERVQHGLLALSFLTLVYTGFALKFPETWMFAWFARLEGGYAWRGIIHRSAAVVMIATSVLHVVYCLTHRGRRLVRDLWPQPEDARDLIRNLRYLVGLAKTPARFDRFGYIEKAEYWALVWGTVVMTVTGFVLWFENQSLRAFEKWVLDLATLIHYYEAWLAFLAIVVWHFYQNITNPDVYPMNWSWITGRVPEDQLRHEHPLEWERVAAAEAAEADEADASAGGAATSERTGEGPAETSGPSEPPEPQRP